MTDSLLTVEIGTRSNDDSQWIPLVEKAYAKLYDSYASLAGGLTSFTMTDLTGIHNRLDGIPGNISNESTMAGASEFSEFL